MEVRITEAAGVHGGHLRRAPAERRIHVGKMPMLESLGPVVSLFKLFIEGLVKAGQKLKSCHKRTIRRKILEIQLSLEAIIDNAQEILSAIEGCAHDNYKLNEESVGDVRDMVYRQHRRIDMLLEQMEDKDSDEVMRLFTPDIRRHIIDLIHIKRGVISNMVLAVRAYENIQISRSRLVASLSPALLTWDHEKFLREGHSYLRSLTLSPDRKKFVISDRLKEQQAIVDSLMQCSKQLSGFIRSEIGLGDVI